MSEKRSKNDIVADILELCKTARAKTEIMYKANLSGSLTKEYVDTLVENKLLDIADIDGGRIFRTSARGFSWLSMYTAVPVIEKGASS